MQKYNKDKLTIKQLVEKMRDDNNYNADILEVIFSTKEWFADDHSIVLWNIDFFNRNYKKDLAPQLLKDYEVIEYYSLNKKEVDSIFKKAKSNLYNAYAYASTYINVYVYVYAYANADAYANANANARPYAYAYAYANAYPIAHAYPIANAVAISSTFANAYADAIANAYPYARIKELIKQNEAINDVPIDKLEKDKVLSQKNIYEILAKERIKYQECIDRMQDELQIYCKKVENVDQIINLLKELGL